MSWIVDYSRTLLVDRHRGTMPVLLTCPHDGGERPSGVSERTEDDTPSSCTGYNKFATGRDREAASITAGIAQKILEMTGLTPYVVIARFNRQYIDANRASNCAFTDPDGRKYYDEYHNRITEYIAELMVENRNRGFLFDIHGVGELDEDLADIYLGTANGRTFRPEFDRNNLFLQHGLHGLLKAAHHRLVDVDTSGTIPSTDIVSFQYRVSPANATVAETGAVNGAYTVRHYASRINCIQIEIANTIRDDTQKRKLIMEDLAATIINFVRRYAPF